MSRWTRRDVLRRAGATVAALGSTAATIGQPALAATAYDRQPDHVRLSFDAAMLERFQPQVVIDGLDVSPSRWFAWVARSSEHDTLVACYWAFYESQTGLTSADSHRLDREPVYVFVDEATGRVTEIVADGYHYLALTLRGETHTVDGTHPHLTIVPPWHFYRGVTASDGDATTLDIDDLHDRYDGWIGAGWDVDRRSVVDPWTIQARGHWWADDVLGLSLERRYYAALLSAGSMVPFDLFGADSSDLS